MSRIKNSPLPFAACRMRESAEYTRRNARYGFTLVELLVAASILGMVAIVIVTVFSSGLAVYEKAQTWGGTQADVLLSLEKMERDLRNVVSLSKIGFNGENKKFSFPARLKKSAVQKSPAEILGRISYYFDNVTHALVKEEEDYSRAVTGEEAGNISFKALAFIEDANFSYYYFDSEAQKYVWRSFWDAEEGIPRGVKIEVVFKDGEKNIKLVRTVLIPVAG